MREKFGVGMFVDEDHELASTSLDLFSMPIVDNSLIHGNNLTIYPTVSVKNNNGPYEFFIPSDGNDYTQLNMTRLQGEIEIVKKADETTLPAAADNVAVINMLPSTMFRQIEVELNEHQIADLSTPTQAWKSYIQTQLSYSEEAKNTHLVTWCYVKETPGKEETLTIAAADGSKAFIAKNTMIKTKVRFSTILHIDFFQSQRLLIPGMTIKLRFVRNDDAFSILAPTDIWKVKLNDLKLKIQRVTIDPEISNSIENKLQSTPICYPIIQSKIKTFLLNTGTQSERISNVYRGVLPKTVYIALLDSAAFNGTVNKNPFVFKDFGLNYFNLYINGEPFLNEAWQPDFANGDFIEIYQHFIDNIGISHSSDSVGITVEDFKSNCCFFAFDFSPDLSNGIHMYGNKTGSLDIQLGFKAPLAQNINCLIYGSFNEAIIIDKNRNVSVI